MRIILPWDKNNKKCINYVSKETEIKSVTWFWNVSRYWLEVTQMFWQWESSSFLYPCSTCSNMISTGNLSLRTVCFHYLTELSLSPDMVRDLSVRGCLRGWKSFSKSLSRISLALGLQSGSSCTSHATNLTWKEIQNFDANQVLLCNFCITQTFV